MHLFPVILNEIVGQVRNIDSLVAEIANASGEQSQGIEQVNTAVSRMDKVTQNNAASAEESAAAAEELNAQSSELRALVEKLGLMVGVTHHTEAKDQSAQTSKNSMRPVVVSAQKPYRHSGWDTGRSQNGIQHGSEASVS